MKVKAPSAGVGRAGRVRRVPAFPARFRSGLESAGLYLRTMLVFVLVWYGAATWIDNPVLLPTPIDVAGSFAELAAGGEMAMHFLASGKRLLFSFVLAGLIGIPLGIVMGLNR